MIQRQDTTYFQPGPEFKLSHEPAAQKTNEADQPAEQEP
jgi:hypothetical protein